MKRHLKINLDAIEKADDEDEEEALCKDGVRVGSLLVSSQGVSAPTIGTSYNLSLQDLILMTEDDGAFLGKGSSGSVRRAVNRRTGAPIALKEIKGTSPAHLREIRRELETLYKSDMPPSRYLVDFYGAFAHEGSVFIAMECLDGSLDILATPVPLEVLGHMTRSMLNGLVYLHRTRHLIHRDLKPSNVLYKCDTGDIKISDFGVSSNLECTKGGAKSFVGTVTYMSPERLRGEFYSYSADIWSLGLVVAELALGACPYDSLRGGTTEARFWALLQHLNRSGPALELADTLDADLVNFITACVAKVPEQRPTCTKLLRHPFIIKTCGEGGAGEPEQHAEDREVIRVWLTEHQRLAEEERKSTNKVSKVLAHASHLQQQMGEGLHGAAEPAVHGCSPVLDTHSGGGRYDAQQQQQQNGTASPLLANTDGVNGALEPPGFSHPGLFSGFNSAFSEGGAAGSSDAAVMSNGCVQSTEQSVNLDAELDKLLF